jgi:hypothetical protein
MREVEVAEQNRQRAVVIEVEKVHRAKDLEIVSREREVELQRIDKEKAIEIQRKDIANVIRDRIVVEKSVAQEEERIKEVRAVSEADRQKQVKILSAQAKAEEEMVRQVKQAEADETSSKHKAVELTVIAQAELEAAGKNSEAKKRMAEGIEAERAAPGLADARVREVTAAAMEKEGMAKARVVAETMAAEAKGTQDKGVVEAKVIKDVGFSQAEVMREKYRSEAEGLTEKFVALGSMSEQARTHEEFRMQLEKGFEQAIASIEANKDIAREQAEVLSTALAKANIDIVGGEGAFFDSFAKALSVGKAVEGMAGKSPIVQEVLQKLMSLGNGKDAPAKSATEQGESA